MAEQTVFVVTGPSGAGKGTLEQALLDRRPDFELAVSATTRARRPRERDGVHYHFLTDAEFDRAIADGDLLEWVDFAGNRYGTLTSEIDRIRSNGRIPLLDLEIAGALRVHGRVADAVTIFVDAPIEVLERRLLECATESSGEIGERLRIAHDQKRRAGEFDYVIVNDDLERAVEELLTIVGRELDRAATMSAP